MAVRTEEAAYPVVYIACRVCGADAPRWLGIRGNAEYSGAPPLEPSEPHRVTNVVTCRACGFVYTNPLIVLPPDDHRQPYHDAEAYVPYAGDPTRVIERVLRQLERLIGRRGRLLDVGAGKGEFLLVAKRRGWEVCGVEPSPGLAAHAQAVQGLPVSSRSLDEAGWPEASFDAVTLNMVLEHVDDPNSLLRSLHRVLAPGGVLFIEVPNLESLLLRAIRLYFRLRGRDWSPLLSPLHWPYHCYGYRARTVRTLAERNGFRVAACRTAGLGPRGFRESPKIRALESVGRALVMRVGGALGWGDVLMVYCRKQATLG